MTAEVIVMNRSGVALAADSAVTVQVGDSSKLRDSALKLFRLSKHHPVGVMVYENSSLLGVPWETIIKLFRETLGSDSRPTLRDYGDALIEYLDENVSLFPEEVQDRYYMRAVDAEYRRIEAKAQKELVDSHVYAIGGRAPAGNDVEWVRREIDDAERLWNAAAPADYFASVTARDVVGRNSGGVTDLVNRVFGNWGIGSSDQRKLLRVAEHLVAKDRLPPDALSGLVIAGFGQDEHFPSVQHIEIAGVYGGKVKARPSSLKHVSEEDPSHVMSFAYTEMVETFLDGFSRRAFRHLQDARAFIREMPAMALEVVPGLAPDDATRLADIVREASERQSTEFARSVLEGTIARRAEIAAAVEALTVKELAQVASTLVSLSSFQQQMSLGRQTVGGPVDVAVISKGDGFIWIDRKHYFRPELNKRFFRDYYRGLGLVNELGTPSELEGKHDGRQD